MFSLRSSIAIFCFLFIPFCLKTIGLEPFPAIELPSGGMVVKEQQNVIQVKYFGMYGLDTADKWVEINKRLFFSPIPIHYSTYILNSNFGVDKAALRKTTRRFKILKKLPGLNNYYSQLLIIEKPSEEDIIERNQWLIDKMNAQGLRPTHIKIIEYSKSISSISGEVKNIVILNEKVILPFE